SILASKRMVLTQLPAYPSCAIPHARCQATSKKQLLLAQIRQSDTPPPRAGVAPPDPRADFLHPRSRGSMKRHGRALGWLPPIAILVLAALLASARGQQGQTFIQYGFESRDPVFVKGGADARYMESAPRLSDDLTAHTGKRSEFFQLSAEPGSFIHYTYDVGRAPVTDELNVSIWIKANRPGAQVHCRVVLPHEHDPNDISQPLTVLARGDKYQL